MSRFCLDFGIFIRILVIHTFIFGCGYFKLHSVLDDVIKSKLQLMLQRITSMNHEANLTV
jgi:hypothetical protein